MAYRTGYKPMGSRMPTRRQQAYANSQYDRVAAATTRRRTNAAKAVAAVSAAAGFIRNRNVPTIRTEKKVIDILGAALAIENATGSPQLLNGCIAGSQNFQRIGRKINMKSLQIRGVLTPTDLTTNAQMVRMIVVYDKQSNGAAPTFANVITSQNIAGATQSLVGDMVNLDNRDRFEIIRDKIYSFNFGDAAGYAPSPGSYECTDYIRLADRPVVFNAGTAGTVGDIQSGALYVFWISSQAAATGSTLQSLSYRLRFIDV